jgi:tetratricopeptide (TPR) repeat protein
MTILGTIIVSLMVLAFTVRWWLSPLISFVGANINVIPPANGLAQLTILVVPGVGAVLGFWFWWKKKPPVTAPSESGGLMRAEGARSVVVGQADNSNILTGDYATVIGQTTFKNASFKIEQLPPKDITYLHQSPPILEGFTDRLEEVAELTGKLNAGSRVYGFFGMGGIGKSDLAKKFVTEYLSARYPDAQFYLDLKGSSHNPKSVAEAQLHVIASCRATEKLAQSDDVDLGARYNDALYGRRAIVFLDNAHSREQVEPLTPHIDCAMVITSRQKIFLSGMHSMSLAPLNAEDACSLLLRLESRIGEQAGAIAALCGGLPQALRIAASTLAEHPDLSVDDYVKSLTDRKKRLEFVEASVDLTYGLLTETQQSEFRRLAVFPETFDAGGAAAIWDLSLDAAKASLRDFFKLSLLDWHERANRYRLQSLVRDFADARLSDSERQTTQSKYALYYLQVVKEAGQRYLQGGDTSKEGLSIFDAEKVNLETTQAWVRSRIREHSVAELAVSNFTYGGAQLMARRQSALARIDWHQSIIDATGILAGNGEESEDLRVIEAENLAFSAMAYRDLGNSEKTIELSERAILIAREVDSSCAESNALGYSGIAYYYEGNYEEARQRIAQAIKVAGRSKHRDMPSDVERLRYLGHSHRGLGEYEEAIKAYQLSLKNAREFGDSWGENSVLSGLGRLYCDTGNQELARTDYLPKALSLAQRIGDGKSECYSLGHLGLACRDLGLYDEARNYYLRGLKLAESMGNRQLETYCHGGLGKTQLALGEFEDAVTNSQIAVQLADEIKMKRAQQFWRTSLAQIFLQTNQLDAALKVVTEAGSYESRWVKYRTLTLSGLILAELGRQQFAAEAFEAGITEAQQLLTRTPRYFDARYFLGIAALGLGLTKPTQFDSRRKQSIEAFEHAYHNCRSAGVVAEALRLLDNFETLIITAEQNDPRRALENMSSRPRLTS